MSTKSLCKQENVCSSYCWRLVDLSFFRFCSSFFLFLLLLRALPYLLWLVLRFSDFSFWPTIVYSISEFSPFAVPSTRLFGVYEFFSAVDDGDRSLHHYILIVALVAPVCATPFHPLPSDIGLLRTFSTHRP